MIMKRPPHTVKSHIPIPSLDPKDNVRGGTELLQKAFPEYHAGALVFCSLSEHFIWADWTLAILPSLCLLPNAHNQL
jgi:hypothetical protein